MEEAVPGALAAASEVLFDSVVQEQQPAAAAAAVEGAGMGMQAAEACAEAVSTSANGMWPPPSVDWDAMVRIIETVEIK